MTRNPLTSLSAAGYPAQILLAASLAAPATVTAAATLSAFATIAYAATPTALAAAALAGTAAPPTAAGGIPLQFSLGKAGWVTLVIDDRDGKRVRNLLSNCYFTAGRSTVYWDGADDVGRDAQAAAHGLYAVPGRLVAPGQYVLRGLWHDKVDALYQHALYSAGNPPWETADTSGGWLSNHTPPQSLLYVPDGGTGRPAMLIGSYVSEGTAGLAWVDLNGKKQKHQVWVGGAWTGAPYLAYDPSPDAVPTDLAYAAVAWTPEVNPRTAKNPEGEIRLTAITAKGDRPAGKFRFTPPTPVENAAAGEARWKSQIGGLAVYGGRAVVSLTALGRLLVLDARSGATIGTLPLPDPHGLAFDNHGNLLALSGPQLVRFHGLPAPLVAPVVPGMVVPGSVVPGTVVPETGTTSETAPAEVICAGLGAPSGLLVAPDGTLYFSLRGESHTVQHRDAAGRLLATFGRPGIPTVGPYDPLHLNNPAGLALDPAGRLWVAEEDYQPKRVSVWNPDGSLWRAFYGPPDYGGGGNLDPLDPTLFYYRGMAMRLEADDQTRVEQVFYRRGPGDLKLAWRSGAPQTPLYHASRKYFTNAFTSNPTNGHGTAFLFLEKDGIARPIAAAGVANEWDALKAPEFKALWPQGTDSNWLGGGPGMARSGPFTAFFTWSDLNDDGAVQPNEVTLTKARSGGVTILDDLSFVVARYDNRALRLRPTGFTAGGVPRYDMNRAETLVEGVNAPQSTGGDQVLLGPDGWSIFTTAPQPFDAAGIGGVKDGVALWSFPSPWPGLHASHASAVPDRSGELIGTTRLLGPPVTPPGGEPLWLLNGNLGPIYVFTFDGLFVTQLFEDMRLGKRWNLTEAKPAMPLGALSPSDENFWPTVSQGPDGTIYLVTGRPNALARVVGLETVHRLPAQPFTATAQDLARAGDALAAAEASRQMQRGEKQLKIATAGTNIMVDGELGDWAGADWALIDQRGNKGYFQSATRPYDVSGAVTVRGSTLYAAWRTGEANLLQNSGDTPLALFKTGGALDLMLGALPGASSGAQLGAPQGAPPRAVRDAPRGIAPTGAPGGAFSPDPGRAKPVAGDLRLLVTQVQGHTRAILYRAVVPGTTNPVPFASPVSTVTFDRVEDVSEGVQLAGKDGNFEIAIPLRALGWPGADRLAGLTIRGDIGILRGSGGATTQRVYWSNKATAIVSDVPSEAELRPNLWGAFQLGAATSSITP